MAGCTHSASCQKAAIGTNRDPTMVSYRAPIPTGSPRPIAAGRQPLGAVIRTTAVLRKLPVGQFTLLGQSRRWRFDPTGTAMVRLPDTGQEIRSSGGFLIPHPAVVDPELPVT